MTLSSLGLILTASALVLLTSEPAQIPMRMWNFTVPNGSLDVAHYVDPDGRIGLRVGAGAPITEHVEPLKQVLAEMSALGADPRKAHSIVMLAFGDDVRRALAHACADSPACRPKTPVTPAMRDRMLDLLEQTRIFEPYNEAFRAYGLEVHVGSADHIDLIPLSAVPARHARDRANAKMRVFGHATLTLEVTSIARRHAGHPDTILAGPRMWSYRSPNRTLRIVLDVNPDGSSRLGLQPDGFGALPPVIEQVEPLRRILSEMAKTGADPQKLGAIAISSLTVVVQPTLAYACADSPRCRPAYPLTREMEEMFMALVNESRILDPYNEALKPYGLRITGSSAENIGLIPLSAVPPRHTRDRANGKMWVFGHATLSLRVTPIPAAQAAVSASSHRR